MPYSFHLRPVALALSLNLLSSLFCMASHQVSQESFDDQKMNIRPVIQCTQSIQNISKKYDLFLVDIMGVVHNGVKAFEEAVLTLNTLHTVGKKVIFLSNTQRLGEASKGTLLKFGIHPETTVFTSGDAIRRVLFENFQGKKIYHLGHSLNAHLTEGINVQLVNQLQEAELVLLSQYIDGRESLDQFDPILKQIAQKGLQVLCVNPDITAPHGNEFYYCSGAFAKKIEAWGGKVHYYGKPNVQIYEVIENLYEKIAKERIIMIGDTLETDIAGAQNYGIDSVLVLTGNTAADIKKSGQTVSEFLKTKSVRPTYIMNSLI